MPRPAASPGPTTASEAPQTARSTAPRPAPLPEKTDGLPSCFASCFPYLNTPPAAQHCPRWQRLPRPGIISNVETTRLLDPSTHCRGEPMTRIALAWAFSLLCAASCCLAADSSAGGGAGGVSLKQGDGMIEVTLAGKPFTTYHFDVPS